MIILGLTGSIAMGKSTAAAQLRGLGLPVFDADAAVHTLYMDPAVLAEIAAILPNAPANLDRTAVAAMVRQQPDLLPKLEAILHPRVRAMEGTFLNEARAAGVKIAVLDIPLLFEAGGADRCDKIAVVTAPWPIQYWRAWRRPGLDWQKFRAVLARQMPDAEKRRRADFVIQTGFGRAYSLWQWRLVLSQFK
jgi:dephospho-CoA kinase